MKQFEFRLENGSGVVLIDNLSEEGVIHINIRYGPPIDNSFDEYSWEGHYRCEIRDGKIVYEGLPTTTNYKLIAQVLNSALNSYNSDIANKIREAYSINKNPPQQF